MPTSHPEYNGTTTASEVGDSFAGHIKNKNVIITGVGPDSLGESVALALGRQKPAMLFLASRTQAKVEQVADKVRDISPTTDVVVVIMNLASQKSVRDAAAHIKSLVDHVDILINNAGMMVLDRETTEEGIEIQFGTNHIGHYLFTNLLLGLLKNAAHNTRAGSTRVINVTSAGHRLSPIRFHDYNLDGKEIPPEEEPPFELPPMFSTPPGTYNGWIAYGQSKTANILFTVQLNRELAPDGITSYSVHPGSIWTGLSRSLDDIGNETMSKTSNVWKNTDQGAATTLVAAFDPALNDIPNTESVYLSDCQLADAANHAVDAQYATRLADLSKELAGLS